VLASLIDARTALVSVMTVNNEIGTIQPIETISSLCRRAGAVFHSDAAQAPAGVRIDVEASGADLLSLSSHKMYGPKGIGVLFVSHSIRRRMRPILLGGGQEAGLRSGTLPTPLCVGFGEAARVAKARLDDDVRLLSESRRLFLDALRARVPDALVNGAEPRHPGQLNLRFPGVDAEMLVANLQPQLAVSNGAACSSGIPEPSHVLRAIGLDFDAAAECVRVGFGRSSIQPQARHAANLIADIVVEIRANSPRVDADKRLTLSSPMKWKNIPMPKSFPDMMRVKVRDLQGRLLRVLDLSIEDDVVLQGDVWRPGVVVPDSERDFEAEEICTVINESGFSVDAGSAPAEASGELLDEKDEPTARWSAERVPVGSPRPPLGDWVTPAPMP
jgi:hypothetical protein